MALAFCLAGASTSIVYCCWVRSLSQRLFLGGREERQIHVHDKAQEYGNAADDRHQLQESTKASSALNPMAAFFNHSTSGYPLARRNPAVGKKGELKVNLEPGICGTPTG